MKVKVINTSSNELPQYETAGAVGLDIRADFNKLDENNPIKAFGNVQMIFQPNKYIIMDPGTRVLIPTGLFVAIPEGYEIQVRPRSGLTLKMGLTVLNSPGTIDPDYRHECGIIAINEGLTPVVIENGERIAQFVGAKVESIEWEPVDQLPTTDRKGGFGSTGK